LPIVLIFTKETADSQGIILSKQAGQVEEVKREDEKGKQGINLLGSSTA